MHIGDLNCLLNIDHENFWNWESTNTFLKLDKRRFQNGRCLLIDVLLLNVWQEFVIKGRIYDVPAQNI